LGLQDRPSGHPQTNRASLEPAVSNGLTLVKSRRSRSRNIPPAANRAEVEMTGRINANRAGIALGAVIGLWHVSWSLLVAFGCAQAVIDFVLWMHFIKPIYMIEPFNLTTAVILAVVTTAIGYVMGLAFGLLWNALHRT
jgi:hypothetical protein